MHAFDSPLAAYAAFILAAGLLTITPGLDTALCLRTSAAEGSRRGFMVGLGACVGCIIWGVLVALGVGALLAASQLAYTILKWAGAAYLCWLGIGMILRPRDLFEPDGESAARSREGSESSPSDWFRRGLFTNMLNPKVGVFYVTFLPQFVPDGVNAPLFMVSLACIHALEGALWFALLVSLTRPLTVTLRKPVVVRALDRVTGVVLVGFGARLLAEARE